MITGAALGIGRAMAYRFADLELIDINSRGLGVVRKELLGFGSAVNIHKVDISEREEIDSLWQGLTGKEPEILVNNAGIYPF